jgi:hypothetical protein
MSVKEMEQMKCEEILAKETRHFKKVSIGQSGECCRSGSPVKDYCSKVWGYLAED